MAEYLELGKILKPQGIKGEIKLDAYTDSLERFDYLEYVYFKDENEQYTKINVEKRRTDTKFAYIKLQGTESRDDAERLRGQILYVDRKNAAKLKEGYFYIKDLLGLKVANEDGEVLGTLKDIMQTGSKDIYVVKTKTGKTLMFPSIDGVILTKDLENRVITVSKQRLEEVGIYNDI